MLDIKLKESIISWSDIVEAVKTSKPDIIYFDTLVKMCSRALQARVDMGDMVTWDALMDNFRDLGKISNAGVVIIHHKNKTGSFHGSQGIRSGVDMLIDFTEDKKTNQPYIEYDGRRTISSDLAQKKNYRQFQYKENKRLVEIVPQHKMNQAEAFLYTYLQKNGSTVSSVIIVAGKKLSISQPSIYEAFKSLNIITGGRGKEWELPPDVEKPAEQEDINDETEY